MYDFFGEYDCKVDAKGRLRLPSKLLEQFGDREKLDIILSRSYENNLLLYPRVVWEQEKHEVSTLDSSIKKNRMYKRLFFAGYEPISVDSADRILLKQRMLDYAQIKTDIVIASVGNYFEMWSRERYDDMMDFDMEEFSDLGEEVRGGVNTVGYDAGSVAPGGN